MKAIEREIWRGVWAKPGKMKLTPGRFAELLGQGASPWIVVDVGGSPLTLLGGLCRSVHCDLSPMLSAWIQRAGNVEDPPAGHPPPLHCLPLDASILAVEKLLHAGANANDPTLFASLFAHAVDKPIEGISSSGFWEVVATLLAHSSVELSDIRLLDNRSPEEFLGQVAGIAAHPVPTIGLEILLSRGRWGLTLGGNAPDWMKSLIARAANELPASPELLQRSNFDWKCVDDQGYTLAHLLVMQAPFSYNGKQVLPVEGLLRCTEAGLSLREDNDQGWSVLEYINFHDWANKEDVPRLLAATARARLDEKTAKAARPPATRRI